MVLREFDSRDGDVLGLVVYDGVTLPEDGRLRNSIGSRSGRQFEASKLLVFAAPVVVDLILDEQSTSVAELEELIGKTIRFQREEQYEQEQFDVVLL